MLPDELIAEHLDLPHLMVNVFFPQYREREELVSEGFIALVRCAHRYDETKNASFRTYATHRVHGAMRDWIRLPSRKREPKMEQLSMEGSAMAAPPQEPFIELVDLIKTLRDGDVLIRYGVHGLPLVEIARQDGYSESRACQRLARGRRELRAILSMQ